MSDDRPDDRSGGALDGVGSGRARRRAAALGDLVPERTGDESRSGWGDRDQVPDEDYLRDVPPHHG